MKDKLIYESEYLSIKFDLQTSVLKCYWKVNSNNVNKQRFKNDLLNCAELVANCRPIGVLSDMTEFDYDMTYEEKVFFRKEIHPKITWYNASKTTILVDEKEEIKFNKCGKNPLGFKYFDNLENANNWLIQTHLK